MIVRLTRMGGWAARSWASDFGGSRSASGEPAASAAGLLAADLLEQLLAVADRPGHHRAGALVLEQDEPAVGVDDVEDHVQDVREQAVNVVAVGQHVGDAI